MRHLARSLVLQRQSRARRHRDRRKTGPRALFSVSGILVSITDSYRRMFHRHSVAGRISVGIVSGLGIGICGTAGLLFFGYPLSSFFVFGTLIACALMGILIGFLGLFSRHPLFNFSMPWWVRGLMVGCVLTLMYTLLGYEVLAMIIGASPFWLVPGGMVLGLAISAIETWFAGEGKDLPLT